MKFSSVSLLMRCFGPQDVCDIQLAINETLNAVTVENIGQMRESVAHVKNKCKFMEDVLK